MHRKRYLALYLNGELPVRRIPSLERHLSRCRRCEDTVSGHRMVQEMLRSAELPVPDPGLIGRLLGVADSQQDGAARTRGDAGPSVAAADPEPAETPGTPVRPEAPGESAPPVLPMVLFAAVHPVPNRPPRPIEPPALQAEPRRHRSRGSLMLTASGLFTLIAVAILAGAYLVGSTPTLTAAQNQTAVTAGWTTGGGRGPVELAGIDVDALRTQGWTCPELRGLGFSLQDATALTIGGRHTLKFLLTDGRHTVTLYEQRRTGEPASEEPINAGTGDTVTADGFTPADDTAGSGQLWVRAGTPWQAVLESGSATYTVVSTLPFSSAADVARDITVAEQARLSTVPQQKAPDPLDSIWRGLLRMTHPAGN